MHPDQPQVGVSANPAFISTGQPLVADKIQPPRSVTTVSVLLFMFAPVTIFAAIVLGLAGAVGHAGSGIPILGLYASHLAVIGIGGAVVLVALAITDIVLGIFLRKGRNWARLTTVVVAVLTVLAALASANPVVIGLFVVVAVVLSGLLVGPGKARSFFRQARQRSSGGSRPVNQV